MRVIRLQVFCARFKYNLQYEISAVLALKSSDTRKHVRRWCVCSKLGNSCNFDRQYFVFCLITDNKGHTASLALMQQIWLDAERPSNGYLWYSPVRFKMSLTSYICMYRYQRSPNLTAQR